MDNLHTSCTPTMPGGRSPGRTAGATPRHAPVDLRGRRRGPLRSAGGRSRRHPPRRPPHPGGFRIIALSHAAEACGGRDDAATCVGAIARSAVDPRIAPMDPAADPLGHHGLYLSHLAIVLGTRDRLSDAPCDEALHTRIVDHLVERSLAHDQGIARSFDSSLARWPTDQAATLYGLWLYDQAHGTQRVLAPRDRFLPLLAGPGLPPTEVTGTAPDPEVPRGSSLAFAARYLAPVAPQAAADLWDRTTATLLERIGPLAGIREWPPGADRAPDIDSGPVVFGIGASATAFGRAAALAVGDDPSARALGRTARLGSRLAAAASSQLEAAANSALATAITAQVELAPQPWR